MYLLKLRAGLGDLWDDALDRGGPDEGLTVLVVLSDKVINLANKVFDAAEGAMANGLLGDQLKEALHLIEPGAIGWDEGEVPAGMSRKPGLHARVRVRAVVVDDHMDVELLRNALVDASQEREELRMAVTRLAGGEHRPIEHIQCREQGIRAVTFVVMGHPFDVAQPQRQHRLGSLKGYAARRRRRMTSSPTSPRANSASEEGSETGLGETGAMST